MEKFFDFLVDFFSLHKSIILLSKHGLRLRISRNLCVIHAIVFDGLSVCVGCYETI